MWKQFLCYVIRTLKWLMKSVHFILEKYKTFFVSAQLLHNCHLHLTKLWTEVQTEVLFDKQNSHWTNTDMKIWKHSQSSATMVTFVTFHALYIFFSSYLISFHHKNDNYISRILKVFYKLLKSTICSISA